MSGREERLAVSLSGGGPWGFRLQGGAGTGLPLIVAKVRRKSKAYRRLREGDRILCVNGRPCDGLTYDQLMDIADNCGTDLHLEILRRECDKENEAPRQEYSEKMAENVPATKELVSFTETSSKTSEEKEGLRIQSVTVVPEPKPFDSFTSSKLEERAPENGPKQKTVEPFPPFRDLQQAADLSTSSRQEVVSGDEKNFTKTITEKRHEVKGPTELSFVRTEQESRSVDSPHSLPDITMDTIDLNNLISETQKRLDSFRNNFGGNGTLDSTLGSLGRKEVVSNAFSSSSSSLLSEKKEKKVVVEATPQFSEQPTPQQKEEKSEVLEKSDAPQEVSNKTEPVKKIPPPTLPKPKLQPSLGEAFKDCLREMETDPTFSLPDIGFTSQSSETSTITTDIPFGTEMTSVTKKKKMFSSSSFYEEPNAIYPTMEEQVEMARKIADSLADDTNKKSKGANMFYKRLKRSTKWIHEGPEPSDESGPGTPEVEPPTPDISQVPFRPSKGPHSLKLVLDPRHPLDLTELRSSGSVISEHNVVSPAVCHGLVKDLQSPVGKGAALFAKRKKKSEEWVVDEEKVQRLLREQKERHFHVPPLNTSPAFNQYSAPHRQDVKLVKSPWEAAMESPFGLCDAAFARVHPDQLADTVMKRADYIRSESLSRESSRMEGCVSPPPLTPAAALHDVYHAKAPRGWEGNFAPINYSPHAAAVSPLPSVSSTSAPQQQSRNVQNGFQPSKKMVFQNFNAVPRLWKGASVH